MTKYKVCYILILFFLVACESKTLLYMELDSVRCLKEADKLLVNGFEIGEINDFEIQDNYSILVEMELEKNLPNDSKFYIHEDLVGNCSVEVELGQSEEKFKSKSLVTVSEKKIKSTPLSSKILNNIINAFDKTDAKDDSILFELRRLNDNLENNK